MKTGRKCEAAEFPWYLKALGAKCELGTTEHDLIKDFFIAFRSNADIQRELLMETRTPSRVLQFAVNSQRGQENQKAINVHLNRHPLLLLVQLSLVQRNQTPTQNPRQGTPIRRQQTQRTPTLLYPCRRRGIQLTPEHLQISPAKKGTKQPMKKAWTLQQSVPIRKAANAKPTKTFPTNRSTNPKSKKHQKTDKYTFIHQPRARYPHGALARNN